MAANEVETRTAEADIEQFVHKALGDVGSALTASLVVIGDRLGLYRALAEGGPATPAELARRTQTSGRDVREWLSGQAAAGYVSYDPTARRFALPPAHAARLDGAAS